MPRSLLRRIAGSPKRSPEGYELDVQVQVLLRLMQIAGIEAIAGQDLASARRAMDQSAPILDARPERPVTSRDLRIGGAAGELEARLYEPSGIATPSPLLVYFHGGGWVQGSIKSHNGLCRALAADANVRVLSVDYRMAPEHRYPAAAEDAIAATRWVFAHARELGADASSVAVGGDSAGGNLAAVVSLELKSEAQRPVFQLLIYPATDMTRSHGSHEAFHEGFMLTRARMDYFLGEYAPDPSVYREPRASPLFAKDFASAPSAFIVTAGFDPLRDEGEALGNKLRAAGVPVEYRCDEGMIHGHYSMTGGIDAARASLEHACRALNRAVYSRRAVSVGASSAAE